MKNLFLLILTLITLNVWSQKDKLTPELRNRKWGYVNEDSEVVVDFQYEGVSDFCEGLAAVKKNGKYGYIDKNGKTVVDFKFDFADDFKSSFARVAKDTLKSKMWGYINKGGSFAFDYQFNYAENFDDFYANVVRDTLSALLKTDGKLFLGKWFYSVKSFKDGYVKVVKRNNSHNSVLKDDYIVAYYDKDEKLLGDRWYSGGGNFINGEAKVSISDECFGLDKKGRLKKRKCDELDVAHASMEYKFSSNEVGKINVASENGVNKYVDEMPKFSGGELGLRKFIASNTRYPNSAREQGIEGKVFIRFVISHSGEVINPQVVKSVDRLLDIEAIRVIKMLPNWIPGKKNGKPAYVWYTVPINFQLQ